MLIDNSLQGKSNDILIIMVIIWQIIINGICIYEYLMLLEINFK